MNLTGKKLLLMGGAAFVHSIRKYADEQGFKLIAVGKSQGAHSRLSDEYFKIDTANVEQISELIIQKKIDGIFVGASEVNIRPAIKIAEKTGIPFYTTQEQWDILANKEQFKLLLAQNGLPLIPEYAEDCDWGTIAYPVIVKPVDGSGARGISVCNNCSEMASAIAYAKEFSFAKKVIIEQFMQGMTDTFVRYHFQNGSYSISSAFDRHVNFSQGGFGGVAIAYTHPSNHIQAYLNRYDEKMQNVFRSLGLKNGVITLQGFVDEDDVFYFYEAGYRLGGSQSYIFTDAVNDSNSLHYMVNYALTGEMADYCIAERDTPFFKKPCCNLYVALRAGLITVMDGVQEVRKLPGVLNVTEMCGVGTEIKKTGSLDQVCLRMHLIGDDRESLAKVIERVYDTLHILDENGEDMILEHFQL